MSLVTELPNDPLRGLVDSAVTNGRLCTFCGGPLSFPCIFHKWISTGPELFFHPACGLEFLAFLGADVKKALSVLDAHAAFRSRCDPRQPHPEVDGCR